MFPCDIHLFLCWDLVLFCSNIHSRMAGFIPFGTPISIGMLIPGAGVATTMFYQWLNQVKGVGILYIT